MYIDGPILTPGPLRHYVLLNDSLSLVCGTGLDSNPQASVTWMAPDGATIMDNARYDLENGPQFIRLNFTHTIPSDSGIWKCWVLVESEQDIVIDGQLVRRDLSPIGQVMVDVELVVIGKFHIRNMHGHEALLLYPGAIVLLRKFLVYGTEIN